MKDAVTGVPSFARVEFDEVYPGVDLRYYGSEGHLEYDFIVAPGADAARITLGVDMDVTIDASGDLIAGNFRMLKPVAYQLRNGRRGAVEAAYRIAETGEVKIEVGPYDHKRPLIIDPELRMAQKAGKFWSLLLEGPRG